MLENETFTLNVAGIVRTAIFDAEFEYDSRDEFGRWERPRLVLTLQSVDGTEYASLDADVSDDTIEALYTALAYGTDEYKDLLDQDTERALDAYEKMNGRFPY